MIKNSYPGKFIVIEGIDGSGHTTQAKLLKDFLIKKGWQARQNFPKENLGGQAVLTKEPTLDSDAGKKIKEILEKKIKSDALRLQKLFTEDREEHLKNKIIPALKQGKVVISDRYCFSSFAYGVSDGVDLDKLIKMNEDFLLPDLTIILKVNPEICLKRIEKRGEEKELFEKKEKLAKVWENYKMLPNKFKNIYIVDGEKPIEEVFHQIKNLFCEYAAIHH